MTRKRRLPETLQCPDCGSLIALVFPMHTCTPLSWWTPEWRAQYLAELKATYG